VGWRVDCGTEILPSDFSAQAGTLTVLFIEGGEKDSAPPNPFETTGLPEDCGERIANKALF